jgi:hypothetical protein
VSTTRLLRVGAVRAALLTLACLSVGCGWRFGPPPAAAWSVGRVDGASLDPGLRPTLESAVVRALRSRGIGSGSAVVELVLLRVEQAPEAAVPGEGTVAWRTALIAELSVADREGCSATLRRDTVWFDAGGPAGVPGARDAALDALADRIAEAAVDQLLSWGPACR